MLLCSNHEGWLQLRQVTKAEMGHLGTLQHPAIRLNGVRGDLGETHTYEVALGIETMATPLEHLGQQSWGR